MGVVDHMDQLVQVQQVEQVVIGADFRPDLGGLAVVEAQRTHLRRKTLDCNWVALGPYSHNEELELKIIK